ncbi:MAG: VOC family protein [Polyangiales bacterium]
MSAPTSRKLFVNLAVRDLTASRMFFESLGFRFDPAFSDAAAACMVISEHASVMLLSEPFFRSFTRNAPCDTRTHTEGMFAVSCASRAEVRILVERALAAGGRPAMPAQDHGFMLCWSFYDLDGHHWEVLWLDPAGLPS